jgi:hypothetical protein
MNYARITGAWLLSAALLAIGFLAPAWSDAQIVTPDQSIGPQSEGTAPLTEGVIVIPNDEPTTKGLDQGFERPLSVPDRMADGDMSRLQMMAPDQTDANVRESDERSALSF